eukprot:CAMPEP_0183536448 /NCGR_PEP_ID=MMETSP0371-20130417/28248_1 /TAXON_ID=268820 /ORGANISM="Peridinium aciculiferum, Strain PAER-2" /LENGTH=50 /DNA_ID=CAMNT_0025737045 /DNA_START=32 /DNA_END=181 /DNA_ORIENTATION=-
MITRGQDSSTGRGHAHAQATSLQTSISGQLAARWPLHANAQANHAYHHEH